MLRQRLITAAILIPITLLFLFFASPPIFCIGTGILMLAAAWEWTSLMKLGHISSRILYLIMLGTLMFLLLFVATPLIFLVAFFWWLLALVLVLIFPRASSVWSKGVVLRGLMGALTLAPSWAAINYIRNEHSGEYVLLFLFVLIWGADSAAYFAGKKWGKTKLIPKVSPGKSIQGVIAALIFAAVISVLAAFLDGPPLEIYVWAALLSVVTVLFSILGDLFESMMKRQVGVKDSGTMIPGHGGLLDRIDSLTAAAPIYALGGLLLSIFLAQ